MKISKMLIAILILNGCADDSKDEVAPLPPNEAIKQGAPERAVVSSPSESEMATPEKTVSSTMPSATPSRPSTISAPEPEWFEKEDIGTIEIIQEEDPIKQRYKEALELLEIDKVDQAIELLRENVKDAPDDAVNHWNLASVHLAIEQGEAALPSLRKALELEPDNTEYALTLAGVELVMGNTSAAEVLLKTLLKAHPEIADVQYQLGLLHLAAGRVDDALLAMRETTKLDPEHPEAWTRTAIIHVEAQRWADALAAVEGVIAAGDPETSLSVEFLHGQILCKLQRCSEAAVILSKAREVGQEELADLAEGECWLKRSDPEKALPLLQAASKRNPACQPCQMFLGDTLFMRAEWASAAEAYQAAAAAEATDWRSRRQAGKCLLNLQRPKEAVTMLEAAVELAAEDAEAWELLGRAYIASGNRAEAWTVMERLEKLGAAERAKTVRQILTR
jgi:predicted Zn-dependent protease